MTDESCTEFDASLGNMGEAEGQIILKARRPSSQNLRKEARQIGKSYQTKKWRAIPERKFNMVQCDCKNECKKLELEKGKIFLPNFGNVLPGK